MEAVEDVRPSNKASSSFFTISQPTSCMFCNVAPFNPGKYGMSDPIMPANSTLTGKSREKIFSEVVFVVQYRRPGKVSLGPFDFPDVGTTKFLVEQSHSDSVDKAVEFDSHAIHFNRVSINDAAQNENGEPAEEKTHGQIVSCYIGS